MLAVSLYGPLIVKAVLSVAFTTRIPDMTFFVPQNSHASYDLSVYIGSVGLYMCTFPVFCCMMMMMLLRHVLRLRKRFATQLCFAGLRSRVAFVHSLC